ncbi:peptidoglycan-binding protein [Longibacter salinarum]|uniref:Peptidoglycan-binding protein n=2 Tax=Longibacter salinarum TaxID=1850348 RepID=A0A2A8CVV7_9BACT|nr:peptidoglycan-binding protein [Longibacter salinarum]
MHAAYRYAAHLGWGRVSPGEVTPLWDAPTRKRDEQVFFRVLERTGDLDAALSTVQPSAAPYDSLLSALQRYQQFEQNGGWPTIPEGPTLKAGQLDARVPVVRERLAITGDLPIPVDSVRARVASAPPFSQRNVTAPADTGATSTAETVYRFDDDLWAAVLRFQRRHGLATDGAIGPTTRAAMNVSADQRVRQIGINLERWRWMPDNLGSRYVVVNIAGFSLNVIEDGRSVLSMRVITGRPFRQTPVFSDEISYLVFNPYWHIPQSLAVQDKLPMIRRDPGYLARQRIQVFRGWGADAARVDPAMIDWSTTSASNFPYRLRQDPGPWNALGRVKFMFPNPYSVYLHDTPERGLFEQAERTFSSGCIRVAKPAELAVYLLADHPDWTPERIRTAMQDGTTEQAVVLNERVLVHLQYWTTWTENGDVHFRNDVYGRDVLLLEALEDRRVVS